MRIYWYWPFAREEDFELALATPGEGDSLVLHALDRPGVPRDSRGRVTVRADLPDVSTDPERSLRWAVSRTATYRSRARSRRSAIASGGFDVAHVAFLNQYTDVVDLRALARRVPLVTTIHDVLPHRSRMPRRAQHVILGRLYANCGTMVVHHADVANELVERFDIDPALVHVVPHWVSPFRAADDRRTLSDRHRILFFGTLRENKGVRVLLEALERIPPDSGIEVHIAGRGDAALEALVRDAAARISFLSAEIDWITPTRKAELFRDADAAVLPYTAFSSQSGVLHDAFGNHLPAIVTDVGALRTSIEEPGAGWVVSPGSVDELADALTEACSDPDRWQRASDGARSVAIAQAPDRIGAAFRSVYASVIDASGH